MADEQSKPPYADPDKRRDAAATILGPGQAAGRRFHYLWGGTAIDPPDVVECRPDSQL